ncbi:TRAP transporter small permease subunit [Acuticoccus sp. M5D2P5]|uniref:TRAP transporter small permease subunit n=1 Tax=Acuticoccus kalidii TaxID=2910977 RepID=UPI001F2F3D5D|nr:TRAP transporter small permease subunit [Acuticoccus kalidii]MCF3935492.1 TRAP transporter small permease subunit [Acuticoccus kalidii]
MMDAFLPALVRRIDALSRAIGRASALLLPVMMLVVVANVVMRYGFGIGMIEFEELQWHINAIVVMGCLAYAYRDDAHVRVDVLHARFSERGRAVIEIVGGAVLLLPFVIGIAYFAWDNFAYSFAIGERSPMPSGLPARYVIKFVLFAGFVLLGLQGIAAIGRGILTLAGRPLADTQPRELP